jgi:hypothetical protein
VGSKIGYTAAALFIAATAVLAGATAANAGTSATSGCAAATAPGSVGRSAAQPSAATVTAAAAYKATHDTEAAQVRALSSASAAFVKEKKALLASGELKLKAANKGANCPRLVSGMASKVGVTPNATVSWLSQYGQVTGSFCGPASVSEASATVPGPSPYNLNQWTVAGYMDGNGGNTINAQGTNIGWEVNGLNHFVGVPDYGRNFYAFVGMDYTPTAAQRSAFESNLAADVAAKSPVIGDAWEAAGGPHLVGHPVGQTIFHYFQIGGTSGSSLYYSDSATTVWSSVPAYSWEDLYTVETILGGRGYIW